MNVVLRLRVTQDGPSEDLTLDEGYSMGDVQREVAQAIDEHRPFAVLLANGDTREINPRDFEITTVTTKGLGRVS